MKEMRNESPLSVCVALRSRSWVPGLELGPWATPGLSPQLWDPSSWGRDGHGNLPLPAQAVLLLPSQPGLSTEQGC